jgi:hypothetical protein
MNKRMDERKIWPCVAIGFAVAFMVSLVFAWHLESEKNDWKDVALGDEASTGIEQAIQDFQARRIRLYVISGQNNIPKYSGTNSGPFQIWFPVWYAKPNPVRIAIEQKLNFYNKKMVELYTNREKKLSAPAPTIAPVVP